MGVMEHTQDSPRVWVGRAGGRGKIGCGREWIEKDLQVLMRKSWSRRSL